MILFVFNLCLCRVFFFTWVIPIAQLPVRSCARACKCACACVASESQALLQGKKKSIKTNECVAHQETVKLLYKHPLFIY